MTKKGSAVRKKAARKPKLIPEKQARVETQKPVIGSAEENMTPGFMKPGVLKRSKRKRIKSA